MTRKHWGRNVFLEQRWKKQSKSKKLTRKVHADEKHGKSNKRKE